MDDEARLKFFDERGYKVYEDARDWLGFTDAEKKQSDLRIKLAQAVRRLRTGRGMTQRKLAGELKIRPSRIAAIELPAGDVSLDLLFHTYFHLGAELGQIDELGARNTEAENREIERSWDRPKKRTTAKPKAPKAKAKTKAK